MNEPEELFKIHRIKNEQGEWMPAIQDVKAHDMDPMWVAGIAYVVIDRYLSSVKESEQTKFYEEVCYWLNLMMKDNSGSEYIEKIKL